MERQNRLLSLNRIRLTFKALLEARKRIVCVIKRLSNIELVNPPCSYILNNYRFVTLCPLFRFWIFNSYFRLNLRVLIVDWDVHHGQGTQFSFYDDPRVLYFSIHRYEHGSFWPELRESNWDCIGKGPGTGYNINVPLNKVGMENWDYAAIFHQVRGRKHIQIDGWSKGHQEKEPKSLFSIKYIK